MIATALDLLRRMLGIRRDGGVERQFGAMPWRRTPEGLAFLLVTSRRTGRWIFPKGGRIALLSGASCAAQEAYEEAGVEGTVADRPLGSYRSAKLRAGEDTTIEVEIYPLEVEVVLDDWPERGQRRRRWAGTEEACILLSEPGLVALVRDFAALQGHGQGPAAQASGGKPGATAP